MREDLRQSIWAAPTYRRGEPITIRFELENTGENDRAVLIWDTPLEREVFDFVEVRFGDRVIPYDGRLVKRGDSTPDSYLRIAMGEKIVEELDLSTAFAFEEIGTYTVTFRTRFHDVLRDAGTDFHTRTRAEHEDVTLEPVSASFELLAGSEPRLTAGQRTRAAEGARARLDAGGLSRGAAESRLRLGLQLEHGIRTQDFGGIAVPDWFSDSFIADDDALIWVNDALTELASWSTQADNALYTEWFGADDAARYQAVREHYAAIRARLTTPHTYDGSQTDCPANAYAYTYPGSDTVWLCALWFSAPATGEDSKFGTFIHEWSHAVAGTKDLAYGHAGAKGLAANRPADAISNADNHEYFVETMADRMLTAAVVWPNGKAYLFVAGRYYRYDIASDRVDPGYPLPIEGNWPGLWGDRVDAGVVWPNGKAYFFRDKEYMRYDIASDRVDPGYPLAIEGNWPGLGGERIDAAVVWPTGKAYFFRGSQYWRYDIASDRVDPGYPLPTAGNWPGLWGDAINGAMVWPNGKAYFFRGWQYVRYDIASDRVDPGYPRAIAENWPLLWSDRSDAAVVWPNGKAYFFRDKEYMRYDIASDRVDPGYPLPIEGNWPGLWGDRVDAGVLWPNGKAYFFRDKEYVRYDIASDRVDPGYPLAIEGNWPGLGGEQIDAAVVWPTGKAYFFRGSQYWRYDIASDRVDPGYPLPTAGNWPGLWGDHLDSAIVWPNGNAYFFRYSHYLRYDIAADRTDPGFPAPIGWNWPGLPGRVR